MAFIPQNASFYREVRQFGLGIREIMAACIETRMKSRYSSAEIAETVELREFKGPKRAVDLLSERFTRLAVDLLN